MELDIKDIMERLPHRQPMLLVDRVLEMDPGKSIVAIKNVTYNEPFFQGHFAHHPVMPGVLIIEALAQAAALFSFADAGAPNLASTKIAYYLVGVDGARFRRPVVPGDQLRMEVSADKLSRSICKYTAVAKVDDQIAAEAKIMCAVRILEE
ncbi:3-hydroxyacyl-ACP dehydratase FabZ [Castellaniella ginsengisoli]|jgi:3-hydroxyacyl-[acyl-carrier-protein] dehydratase|uniref:3-hydroxyacyl-[acyl-carrier-protein] dehydratase FabZ n=5 Tax=Castellaniella TaxID=359336 RepID=W8X3W4_CASD6|nr:MULTISPECIES: 3-hydroxyacyl-ACP dehydratase FabZ [Castellaniella]MBN9403368.1 3-hydroxyacyl-ACP dehydratase FabZ [Burkholderiales bacterium]KAB0610119.1 3-hydroxyacyl-ACP dehydratase FabZ [Castellaniella defragrans]MBB6084351.1 3-hydroxyacyl-[acyl-carrier-protein] dehydratase [Castellaniella defragrans]MDY0308205.1 3-hydroxyacyl-ACP dehydratase FabZ [Castellaniella sp.]CDM24447.1 3-hydroxyacyl-[acyl-carrier-protein] dehydratase, FabZ form [Castellaniella defragrans 65Phen]